MTDELLIERDGHVTTLTLARPAKLNALTSPILEALVRAADMLERDDDCRAVILTGEGPKAFCAGADIVEWGDLDPLAFGRHWVRSGHRVYDRLARLRQPLIAMLNGIAFGGGLELAATADLRVAEAHVRLALPETRIGIIPGWSGTQRLVRRVGPQAVRRLALTGEPMDAAEAMRIGLVDEVVPTGEGMTRALALARTIAERGPVAVQTTKILINSAELEEDGAAIEMLAGALVAGTEDAKEGVASFKEKRTPSFKNA
ncbi:MAG: enoyl-CoA hydratase/isomerase family protein [Geminicoccaceae bacterium]